MKIIDTIRGRIAERKTARLEREVPEMFEALDYARTQSVLASCLSYARRDVDGRFSGGNDELADALTARLRGEGWEIRRVRG